MSNSTTTDDRQKLMTEITATLAPIYQQINNPDAKLHLTSTQLPLFLAGHSLSEDRPACVLIEGSAAQASRLKDATIGWGSHLNSSSHYHLITGPLTEQEQSGLIITDLSRNLHHLLDRPTDIHHHYLIPLHAPPFTLPTPADYATLSHRFTIGEHINNLTQFTKHLHELGYSKTDRPCEVGSFRIRGEYIDIYHPLDTGLITMTLHHHTIEQITFTQGKRSYKLRHYIIRPMKFPPSTLPWQTLFSDHLLMRPGWASEYNNAHTLIYDAINPSVAFPWQETTINNLPASATWHIFTHNPARVQRYVRARGISATLHPSSLALHSLSLTHQEKVIISEASLLQEEKEKPIPVAKGLQLMAELTIGTPAVHRDHGIGIYEGLHQRTINNRAKDYLVLRYAEGDSLSVPIEYAHKITAYLGSGTPPIHRLSHTTAWKKTTNEASRAAADFAHHLLTIASKRKSAQRTPYAIDTTTEEELTSTFPYQLTLDQAAAWMEVKNDLQKTAPMDRLIVGDVGFGKTEIALRAAYAVAKTGRQVALIAPTTLLVQQHYDTFTRRLQPMAKSIGLLSRFISPRTQRHTREKITSGDTTIVIGTHALLAKKLQWKNLGLVIIDEEQRFGVTQKEHFKKIRAHIDVLSLSATPIPRTLSLALTGVRDLSIIATPPTGRKSVQTFVTADSDEVMHRALKVEENRHGQAYLVAPHIRDLPALARRVKKIAPHLSTAIAHGQLNETALASVMHQFDTGEIDVLISSTIVESGLDLPNVNTIIVWNSPSLGLSDLYQLRGRIGRRTSQGYAYFLYKPDRPLTIVQRQRLTALTESSRLGSGWQLAQRDLEIRGAGNILGAEQSGTVSAVGLQLYLDLVQEEVRKIEQKTVARRDVEITLPLPAIIPESYLSHLDERTHWYQQLTRATTPAELIERTKRLIQVAGPLPPEAENFVALLHLQHVAASTGLTHLTAKEITPTNDPPFWRLTIEAKNLPLILQKLGSLGTWKIRHTTLTLDIPVITHSFIKNITRLFS